MKKLIKKNIIRTVNILGTPYKLIVDKMGSPKDDGALGYVECYAKKIVIVPMVQNEVTVEKVEDVIRKTVRHEIVHAFIHESGLEAWNENEIRVDWVAAYLPAMAQACSDAIGQIDWNKVIVQTKK